MKRITATHVLLAVVAVFLFLNWRQTVTLNKTLQLMEKDLTGIDVDLTGPINVSVEH